MSTLKLRPQQSVNVGEGTSGSLTSFGIYNINEVILQSE